MCFQSAALANFMRQNVSFMSVFRYIRIEITATCKLYETEHHFHVRILLHNYQDYSLLETFETECQFNVRILLLSRVDLSYFYHKCVT